MILIMNSIQSDMNKSYAHTFQTQLFYEALINNIGLVSSYLTQTEIIRPWCALWVCNVKFTFYTSMDETISMILNLTLISIRITCDVHLSFFCEIIIEVMYTVHFIPPLGIPGENAECDIIQQRNKWNMFSWCLKK